MKKVIFFAITAFTMTVFSSFKVAPPAVVSDSHIDVCGPFGDFVPCTGEFVTTTGCYGIDLHTVINGNRANLQAHLQGHLTGTGSLGNEYEVNINENQSQSIPLSGGAFNANVTYDLKFTGKGSAPNWSIRITQHITINANGVVTVLNTDVTETCG